MLNIYIYEGSENPFLITRVYSTKWLCSYDMLFYPFDTQVKIFDDPNEMARYHFIFSSRLVMAVSGESGDTTQFAEYIAKNIALYKMRNG